MLGVLVGCIGIVCVCKAVSLFDIGATMQLISAIMVSGILYGAILIMLHNDVASSILRKVYRTYEK